MLHAKSLPSGVAIALAVVSSVATAEVAVTYSANASGTPVNGSKQQPFGTIAFDGGDASTQDSFVPDNPTTLSASFILRASHGALGAASLAVVAGGNSFAASANASANVRFVDTITIDAEGMTGQQGVLGARMLLRGVLSEALPDGEMDPSQARATMSASMRASTALGNPFDELSFEDPEVVDESLTLDIPFIFGQAFTLEAELDTTASAQMPNFPGATSAIADFSNSLNWAGPDYILDSMGTEVLNFTIGAESGVDYAQPIPSPATLWLLGPGIGLAMSRSRRG